MHERREIARRARLITGTAAYLLTLALAAHAHADITLERKVALLDTALLLHPDDADARLERADLLRRLTRFEEAHADLDALEARGASRLDVLLLRGVVHHDAGAYDDADDALSTYVAHGGASMRAFLYRARARRATRRHLDAAADFERAARSGVGDVQLYLEWGGLLSEMGAAADAARVFDEGTRRTGAAVLREALVEAALDSGDLDGASRAVEEGLRASAGARTVWLLHRARVHDAQGRPRLACRDLAMAHGATPEQELRPALRPIWRELERGCRVAR